MLSPYRKCFIITKTFSPVHRGIDLYCENGEPIHAITGGTVLHAGKAINGLGNMVSIESGTEVYYYGHLDTITVKAGQAVKQGDVVGTEGNTGNSKGSHLHLAVVTQRAGNFIDPAPLMGLADAPIGVPVVYTPDKKTDVSVLSQSPKQAKVEVTIDGTVYAGTLKRKE